MNLLLDDYNERMEIQRVVALNLARARGEMSREDLAVKAGVTYQHIYEIEKEIKKPSLKVLERVAEALGIEIYTLLKEDNPKPITRDEPVSKILIKLSAIPDKIYDLAVKIPKNDSIWEEVEGLLEEAMELASKKSNHSS